MKMLILLILFSFVKASVAQTPEIKAQGKVMDAITRKGVKAKIFYKSYPTGGITGRFNDSTFSFPIFGSSKYQITAEVEGYITGTALVDPKDIDSNKPRLCIREIESSVFMPNDIEQTVQPLLFFTDSGYVQGSFSGMFCYPTS